MLEVRGQAAALRGLVEEGILAASSISDGRETWRFVSSGLRVAAAEGMPGPEKARLHGRAAEALEYETLDGSLPSRGVALHLLEAGLPERARPYLHRAVQEALREDRFLEAASLLRRWIGITASTDANLPELLRRLGQLELDLSRYADAAATFERALASPAGLSAYLRARCLAGLGRAGLLRNQLEAAERRFEDALEASGAERGAPGGERARWWHQLAWIRSARGAPDEARQALSRAVEEGLPEGSRLAVEHAAVEASLALKAGTVDDELVARLEAAAQAARRLDDERSLASLHNALIEIHRRRGALGAARAHAEAMVQLSRSSFDLAREAAAHHNLAAICLESAAFEEALGEIETAAELYRRVGNVEREAANRLDVAALLLEHGGLARAALTIERGAQCLSGDDGTRSHLYLDLLRARLDLRNGRLEALPQRHAELIDRAQRLGDPILRLEIAADVMELFLRRGDLEPALEQLGPMLRLAGQHAPAPLRARLHRLAIEAHRLLSPQWAVEPGESSAGVRTLPSAQRSSEPAAEAEPLAPPPGAEEARLAHREAPEGGRDRPDEDPLWDRCRWLEHIQRLIELQDDEVGLARSLAALAGEMLEGRGLALLFDLKATTVARAHGVPDDAADDVSRTVVRSVRQRKKSVLYRDVRLDEELGSLHSLRRSGVRSVLCAPMLSEGVCVGALYVDSDRGWGAQTEEALALVERVCHIAAEVLGRRRARLEVPSTEPRDFGLLGASPAWRRFMARIEALTQSTDPTLVSLLVGETGTGKSAIARAVHQHGSRARGPFAVVNCGSIPSELFEALMFGSVRGAFTGAEDRPGFLGEAQGGTLFLDEIHHLPVHQQPKLLTALSSRTYRRVGERTERDLNIHLICATTADLHALAAEKRFLEDLLRRIYVNVCVVPPLRERGLEDITLIARHLLQRSLKDNGARDGDAEPPHLEDFFTRDGRDYLLAYPWPWNVGQLESLFRDVTVQRTLLSRQKIDSHLLDTILGAVAAPAAGPTSRLQVPLPTQAQTYHDLQQACEDAKTLYIEQLYRRCGENATEVARRLDCSRDIVHKYIRRIGQGGSA